MLYDLHSHSIITSRNVVFYENHFPQIINTQPSCMEPSTILPEPFSNNPCEPTVETAQHPVQEPIDQTLTLKATSPQPRRSTRTKQTPTYLRDYHRDLSSHDTNASTKVRYPLS